MLHERDAELGILCWPNLDPLAADLTPLLIMRERVPLVAAPEMAARLGPRPSVEEILAVLPRVITLAWWQVYPDPVVALCRRAQASVELPTGPARRLAIKGEGFGFFVMSSVAADIAAGRLVEIEPADIEPMHRDTAMVVRSPDMLDREMLRDFAIEIARECSAIGTILENRLAPSAANAA